MTEPRLMKKGERPGKVKVKELAAKPAARLLKVMKYQVILNPVIN